VSVVDVMKMQLGGSFGFITDRARDVEPYWTRRGFTGASLPGFVAWHCARIIDWGVNTVVRDEPELAAQPQWRERILYDMGHGAGLSDEQADDVAKRVRPGDVIEYTSQLKQSVIEWLTAVEPDELERVVDLRARNQDHPLYRTDAAWDEIKQLEGIPVWQFLARPCTSHIRVHSGELETLAHLLQTQ